MENFPSPKRPAIKKQPASTDCFFMIVSSLGLRCCMYSCYSGVMSKLLSLLDRYSRSLFWLIFIVSLPLLLMPGGTEPGLPYVDKVAHFLLFGAMALTCFLTYKKKLLVAVLIVAYMFVIEYIQGHFIPHRSEDIFDVVAGVGGLLVAAVVVREVIKKGSAQESDR